VNNGGVRLGLAKINLYLKIDDLYLAKLLMSSQNRSKIEKTKVVRRLPSAPILANRLLCVRVDFELNHLFL
jgi:hypothetical protein